jgi:2-methylisocitrate lyase-like PEP mutase family enzyme
MMQQRMLTLGQQEKAGRFRSLHQDGTLLLANVWDVASAVVVAGPGARVLATTTAGMSWSEGRPWLGDDGYGLSREEMLLGLSRIVSGTDLPVTLDIQDGFGSSPEDVAATVGSVVAAGAVGINLRDSRAPDGGLYGGDEQAARIHAARVAAWEAGLSDLYINARTDVFLSGVGFPGIRLPHTLARARVYSTAGADCLFVPGLRDLETIRQLVHESPLPINVLFGPESPDIAALADAGVRRISTGVGLAQAAYALVDDTARQLFSGRGRFRMDPVAGFAEVDGWFSRPPVPADVREAV